MFILFFFCILLFWEKKKGLKNLRTNVLRDVRGNVCKEIPTLPTAIPYHPKTPIVDYGLWKKETKQKLKNLLEKKFLLNLSLVYRVRKLYPTFFRVKALANNLIWLKTMPVWFSNSSNFFKTSTSFTQWRSPFGSCSFNMMFQVSFTCFILKKRKKKIKKTCQHDVSNFIYVFYLKKQEKNLQRMFRKMKPNVIQIRFNVGQK